MPKSALANINGEAMLLSEAKIPALDRGFLFGDAVYEVIRVYQGEPWLLSKHLRRLSSSLTEIRLEGVDLNRLEERIAGTIEQGQFGEALIYIQITRGAAPRRHAFPDAVKPLEFFYVQEFVDPYPELRHFGARAITHPDLRWHRCDVKSTNLLGNVLAMQAAKEANAVEALLYQDDETLTEGTHTSLFGVKDGVLLAAPQGTSRLPGITREFLLDLADKQQIPIRQEPLSRNRFTEISELFLTGTTTEVLPLVQVDAQSIGDGKPGPVTRRLQQCYRQNIVSLE